MNANPRIYNYSNLKEEDKQMIRGIAYATNTLSNALDNIDLEPCETLKKMYTEIAENTIEDCEKEIYYQTIDLIVGIIDNFYEGYECKEYDTDDYFFGLKDDIDFPNIFVDDVEKAD